MSSLSQSYTFWIKDTENHPILPRDPMLLSGTSIQPSERVRDLGVIVDSELSLAAHISYVTGLCFYHIRQMRLIRCSLSTDVAHTLAQAMTHSRLDNCNGLLAGLPAWQTTRLPFCMLLLDLFCSYQAVLLFQQPCLTRCIGLPFLSESPTSYVC